MLVINFLNHRSHERYTECFVMGSLHSLSLLALLLVTFVDQICGSEVCGSEVKNETNQCFVEGTKKSGKSSNIETSLFSIYHKMCNILTVKWPYKDDTDYICKCPYLIESYRWNFRLMFRVWKRTEKS
jgi:hypothetical protein